MDVIISPLITEKSMSAASAGKYSFVVDKRSNKNEIKSAIEKNFNVSVTGISTSITKGRTARSGQRRIEKKLPDFKKAIVTLKKGEKIGLFELGEEKKK